MAALMIRKMMLESYGYGENAAALPLRRSRRRRTEWPRTNRGE
jgi:hypothetical protein